MQDAEEKDKSDKDEEAEEDLFDFGKAKMEFFKQRARQILVERGLGGRIELPRVILRIGPARTGGEQADADAACSTQRDLRQALGTADRAGGEDGLGGDRRRGGLDAPRGSATRDGDGLPRARGER